MPLTSGSKPAGDILDINEYDAAHRREAAVSGRSLIPRAPDFSAVDPNSHKPSDYEVVILALDPVTKAERRLVMTPARRAELRRRNDPKNGLTPIRNYEDLLSIPESAPVGVPAQPVATGAGSVAMALVAAMHPGVIVKTPVKISGAFGSITVPYDAVGLEGMFLICVQVGEGGYEPPTGGSFLDITWNGRTMTCLPVARFQLPGENRFVTLFAVDKRTDEPS